MSFGSGIKRPPEEGIGGCAVQLLERGWCEAVMSQYQYQRGWNVSSEKLVDIIN